MYEEYESLVDIKSIIEAARKELVNDYEVPFQTIISKWPLLSTAAQLLEEVSEIYAPYLSTRSSDYTEKFGQIRQLFKTAKAELGQLERDFESFLEK
jgi:hypothetical protein